MNEQIKLLIKEAGIIQPERFDAVDGSNQLEKFAELVVTECAMIANRLENDEFWVEPAYDVITKHFGIE